MSSPRTLKIPIYYGTISQYDKKSGDKSFFAWIAYLKSAENVDLSPFIEKVVFVLHHTFAEPIREVRKCPYVIEEYGYGEFEIIVRVFFRPPFESSSVEYLHELKFHQSKSSRQQYIHQCYDELVFRNCDPALVARYEQARSAEERLLVSPSMFKGVSAELIHTFNQDKRESLKPQEDLLQNAIEFINDEIRAAREKVTKIEADILAESREVSRGIPDGLSNSG
jgi:YEATS domain-containing protein 4